MRINKSSGQAARLLLVLAVIVLVAVIVTFLVMKMAEKPPAPLVPVGDGIPMPVYEQALGNIRFVFESALDMGGALRVSNIKNTQFSYQKEDLPVSNPGAKFIKVTVGAQNIGMKNTEQGAWNIENIVDSKGREFEPLDGYQVNPWLPNPNLCSTLLKPAFDPTPCVKFYEVSKESAGLRIRVETGKDNGAIASGKVDSYLIDLIVK